jgi:hypothetical protein
MKKYKKIYEVYELQAPTDNYTEQGGINTRIRVFKGTKEPYFTMDKIERTSFNEDELKQCLAILKEVSK